MTVTELLDAAIATAIVGTEVDKNPILRQRLEASAIVPQVLNWLATEAAANPEVRARLEAQFSVTLSNGVGSIPDSMFVEYLREGSVRDSDTSANNGKGNRLSRVVYYNDFVAYLPPQFGYYCVVDNAIQTRAISSGSYTDTISPLVIDAPFIPTPSDMDTTVPDEILNNLIEMLAVRLRGIIQNYGAPDIPKQ